MVNTKMNLENILGPLEAQENDDANFLFPVKNVVRGTLQTYEPKEVYIIKIDNWFDAKWLQFSGKISAGYTLGGAGFWMKELTFPPFNPNRVVGESFAKLNKDDNCYENQTAKIKPHIEQYSEENFKRKLSQLAPNAAFFWFSGNSKPNGRGCLMSYLPSENGHWPWYVGFANNKKGWIVEHCKGIGVTDFDNLEQTGSL